MKIGIWLGEKVSPTMGGGSSYVNRLLSLIDNYQFSEDIELCYISIFPIVGFKRKAYNISQIPSLFYSFFSSSKSITNLLRRIDMKFVRSRGFSKVLTGLDVKMVYYLQQTLVIDSSFPFISTNWDIGHRSTFSFPEMCKDGIFESRDHFYMDILPKALMIICESETGKQELIKYTNIGEHKIRIMPIFAGNVSSLNVSENTMMNILRQNGLDKHKFFYYPAQFWPHKNHIGLLQAFYRFIKEKDENFHLVLSGSDPECGNLSYIKKITTDMGLGNKVKLLGFVSEEEVYTFYKNATCLVMASHFGPTNMPPIEAMELGCPVACSDLGGHREILGDSGVYFNSFSSDSIYDALVEMVDNRESYVSRVNIQKNVSIFNSESAVSWLNSILHEAVVIRSNWQ